MLGGLSRLSVSHHVTCPRDPDRIFSKAEFISRPAAVCTIDHVTSQLIRLSSVRGGAALANTPREID